jgi:hypothetical protein
MKNGMIKKTTSILMSIILLSAFSLNSAAFSISENKLNYYDGLYFENNVSLEDIDSLTSEQKELLKMQGGIIEEIGVQTDFFDTVNLEKNKELPTNITTMATNLIPQKNISGRIVVSRNSQNTSKILNFYVTWNTSPTGGSSKTNKDIIALSWHGGSALQNSWCNRKLADGTWGQVHTQLHSVKANAGVAYEVITSKYLHLCLTAVISPVSDEKAHNVVGEYAHKTNTKGSISVAIKPGSITFTATNKATYQTMSPVYISTQLC